MEILLKSKIEQLEKELKQTKRNFKNSQIHSKNCYKKLKEKFERCKEVYHRNYELIQENGKLKQENQGVKDDNTRLWHGLEYANNENAKLKQAISILKEHIGISFYDESLEVYIYEDEYCTDFSCLIGFGESEIDEYLLLKEVFESVGGSDERKKKIDQKRS